MSTPTPQGRCTDLCSSVCDIVDEAKRPYDLMRFSADSHRSVDGAMAGDVEVTLPGLIFLWEVVAGAEVDERFCTALRGHGAELGSRVPPTLELAGLFRASAAVAIQRRTFEVAEVEAMRELTVRGALADPTGEAVVLARLSRIFRAQGRLRRVMDMSDELVALRQRTRDRPGVAQALRMVGQVLIEAGRLESAVRHLERARTVQVENPGIVPRQVAGVRVLVGLARWLTGSRTIARREFTAATGLLAAAGDATAAAVEALLAVPSRGDAVPEVGELLWLGAEELRKCDHDLYERALADRSE